ncbi:hypothetical protein QFC20_002471 [Naganishia adeliensis]|uniref:Uncharacterized protein n=1 Tax=Naganishia adeliensis TaxID=92952 RepID=A0ACC2WK88_9TREE|nr:hypothetical protein QFC20_002471 [Naganishia adeliensis]
MDRNPAQAGTSLSPLKTFLAAASFSEQAPRNTPAQASPSIPTARVKEEKDAWERNLMAVMAMRGKLGGKSSSTLKTGRAVEVKSSLVEISQGIQEWKSASTTLQFLVKEVQQLSAKQNSSGEHNDQEKNGNDEKPISGTLLDKVCADMVQQAEEIHSKVSQQITDQTSGIGQDVVLIKEQLGMVQAELQSAAGNSEQLVQYNIELSKTQDTRLSEMAEIIAAMRELSQSLEKMVAKGAAAAEELSRQRNTGDSPTFKEATADKSTTTHQGITGEHLLNESDNNEDPERGKQKNATVNDDTINQAMQFLSEHLSNAIQEAINGKAEEVIVKYRESMETRLDGLEHKLDLLLSARETREAPSDPDTTPTSPQRGLGQQGNGHAGTEAYNSPLTYPSDWTSQSASASKTDATPQTTKILGAKQGGEIEVDACRATVGQQSEREVHEARMSSSGAKKRMLITFSSSDDEAEESVNVKRARPTSTRGTKSLTPPRNILDSVVLDSKPKSSSATVISTKPDNQRRRPAVDLSMKAPVVASRARRLNVSPELP